MKSLNDTIQRIEKEFDNSTYHEEVIETHLACEYLLNNNDGKCNCQLKDIKSFYRSQIKKVLKEVCGELIGEDEYPKNNEQNVNYKRTLRAKHRDELKADLRKKLSEMLGGGE